MDFFAKSADVEILVQMAESAESREEIDTENELKSTNSTQKELEDLEKQAKEDNDTSRHLNSSIASNVSTSEVLKSGENSSSKAASSPLSETRNNAQGTCETTNNVVENPDAGITDKAVKTKVNGNAIVQDSLPFLIDRKQDVLNNPTSWSLPVVGPEDWDRDLQGQVISQQNAASLQGGSNVILGAENWDREMQEQGIVQPHFILRKEDAVNEGVFNAVRIQESEFDDSSLGAVGGSSPSTGTVVRLPPQDGTQSLYHIKWVKWKNLNTPIITQNENGPCPLIALMNVLILQRKISIPPMQEIVSSSQLMEYLGDCILAHAPEVSALFRLYPHWYVFLAFLYCTLSSRE